MNRRASIALMLALAACASLAPRRHRYGLQYYFPPEHHQADLDGKLTPETAGYWRQILAKSSWKAPDVQPGMTRGQYIDAIAAANPTH